MRVQYRVPVNGRKQFYPLSFLLKSVVMHNLSGDVLNLDNGQDPVVSLGAGLTQTVNFESNTSQMTVWTSSNTTGEAWIETYDSPQPINSNPNSGTQNVAITSGSVTITAGTVDINTMPPVTGTVNVGTMPAVNVSTLPAITGTVTSIPSGTQAVSGTFIDPNVAANTGAMLGLLTRFTSFFTLAGSLPAGATHTEVTANPLVGFGLTSTITGAGRLNVWVSGSGVPNVYLVRNRSFYASPMTRNPIEKRFAVPVKAGDAINISWDDATTAASFVMRY